MCTNGRRRLLDGARTSGSDCGLSTDFLLLLGCRMDAQKVARSFRFSKAASQGSHGLRIEAGTTLKPKRSPGKGNIPRQHGVLASCSVGCKIRFQLCGVECDFRRPKFAAIT